MALPFGEWYFINLTSCTATQKARRKALEGILSNLYLRLKEKE
jgi:hypothetical protein